jgi:hypothetical protein
MPRPNRTVDCLTSYSPKSVAADSGTLSRCREYPEARFREPRFMETTVPLLGHYRQADLNEAAAAADAFA